MMILIENEDNVPIFKGESTLVKKINAVCRHLKVRPIIRVYHKESGDERGTYYKNVISLFYSKPETPNSMFWVFLHELKHHIMEHNLKLYREFYLSDDVIIEIIAKQRMDKLSIQKQMSLLHDLRPTEVLCNAFATEVAGKDYGVVWYQRRVEQFKKKKKEKK